MRITKSLLIAGTAFVALAAAGQGPAYAAAAQDVPLTTPLGITIQEILGGGGAGRFEQDRPDAAKTDVNIGTEAKPLPFFPGGPRRGGGRGYSFANAEGKSLYTFDKDTEVGKSACYDDCAKNWPPAIAPKNAKAFGDWTIITRTDKTKQWAYKGKPLYAFVKDAVPGDVKGNGAAQVWHNVKFEPAKGIEVPYGMSVSEAEAANGIVLVDSRRMTMYALDGKETRAKTACVTSACPEQFVPVSAALLANPKGDFTLVDRDDGVKQWAFKGKPLFTYTGDYVPGDANGVGVDKKYTMVMLAKHFVPKGAAIIQHIARGPIVATDKGMTLYHRDTSYHQPDGHGLPGSTPGSPAVGREMGVRSCRDTCLVSFKPFVAPADAVASGSWEIMTRPEGTRQWAYKGFAMYTYTGDKVPGHMTANDIYDIVTSDDGKENVYEKYGVVNNTDSPALFWTYTEQ